MKNLFGKNFFEWKMTRNVFEKEIVFDAKIKIPRCKNLKISIVGGGGGGAGSLYDNLSINRGTYFSAGGGGGGCGEKSCYFIKKNEKCRNMKIFIGNGGIGGIGGIKNVATNGDNGGRTKILFRGKYHRAKGGKGGKIGISSKIGGNGGSGGGGGGGYSKGGIGGYDYDRIGRGQNGTSRPNVISDPNMKGGNGANNTDNGANGSTSLTLLKNKTLEVGGGGGGCGITGGKGGSCGVPATTGLNYGEGGGGGAGFNLDSFNGANGGNGKQGYVLIRYEINDDHDYSKDLAISIGDNMIGKNIVNTNLNEYPTTCICNSTCDSNPIFLCYVNDPSQTLIGTTSWFSTYYNMGYRYISVEIGAGGGGGGAGENAQSGGGGGSGEKFLLNSIDILEIGTIFNLDATLGAGGLGGNNNNDDNSATAGANTTFTIIYTLVKNVYPIIIIGTLKGGAPGNKDGKGGNGVSGGSSIPLQIFFSYGGGGAANNKSGGKGECNFGISNGENGGIINGGNGGGPPPTNIGGMGGKGYLSGGGGGGGGGANGGNGGSPYTNVNGESGKCGDGGGGGYSDENTIGNGGDGGDGYVKIFFTIDPIVFSC